MILREQLNIFLQKASRNNFIYSSSRSHYMSYLGFWIFHIWRKTKNRCNLFITIPYSNNNNFSYIPIPSKSSINESRINGWINYCCTKRTKINNLIKETQIFFIIFLLILGSKLQYELIHKPLCYRIFYSEFHFPPLCLSLSSSLISVLVFAYLTWT